MNPKILNILDKFYFSLKKIRLNLIFNFFHDIIFQVLNRVISSLENQYQNKKFHFQ
jgi:hypothetical protein